MKLVYAFCGLRTNPQSDRKQRFRIYFSEFILSALTVLYEDEGATSKNLVNIEKGNVVVDLPCGACVPQKESEFPLPILPPYNNS